MEKDNRNKIVIVEDDDIYREMIEIRLESKGYHIVHRLLDRTRKSRHG